MKRLLEGQSPEQIQAEMGVTKQDYDTFTLTYYFKVKYRDQLKLLGQDYRRQTFGNLKATNKNLALHQAKQAVEKVPKAITNVKIPKGVSEAEWALKRINEVTPAAVERLVWLMNNSRNDSIMYNSAVKLLGLNGIVEVEKSISVIADAEAIIRELNKRGPYTKKIEATDAEILEETSPAGDSGESEPLAIGEPLPSPSPLGDETNGL